MASIERRVRAGKVSYSVRYRSPDGRSRRRDFPRKVDASRFLVEVEHTKGQGAFVDPTAGRVRLGEWAERWFHTTADLRPGTRRTYRLLLDRQVLPALGEAPLAGIDTLLVREWLASLTRDGLSPSRIRNAHQVLGQVLASAVEGGRLARNPATGVRLPKLAPVKMLVLDPAEVEVLAASIERPYGVLVRFLAWTGLRVGEVAALRVHYLDLLAGRAEIVESATEVGGRLVWGPTKTYERRSVPLPRFLGQEVGAYLADRPHDPDALVFTMPAGGPLRASKFGERYFRPAVRAAGLPEALRVHDLRHTAASLAIREGASVKAVQAMLGHKSATVTLDRYGHLYPDELEALADRLDRAHAAAVAADVCPQRVPSVAPLRKRPGQ
jgi:integrase